MSSAPLPLRDHVSLEEAMHREKLNWYRIPPHMQDSLRAFFEVGCPVGGFLTAVLSNDLMESFARADSHNRVLMHDYCLFLYNQAPQITRSKKGVEEWISRGGLTGLANMRIKEHNERLAQELNGGNDDDQDDQYPVPPSAEF